MADSREHTTMRAKHFIHMNCEPTHGAVYNKEKHKKGK